MEYSMNFVFVVHFTTNSTCTVYCIYFFKMGDEYTVYSTIYCITIKARKFILILYSIYSIVLSNLYFLRVI